LYASGAERVGSWSQVDESLLMVEELEKRLEAKQIELKEYVETTAATEQRLELELLKQAEEKEELTKQIEAANSKLVEVRAAGAERREGMAKELKAQTDDLDIIKEETERVQVSPGP